MSTESDPKTEAELAAQAALAAAVAAAEARLQSIAKAAEALLPSDRRGAIERQLAERGYAFASGLRHAAQNAVQTYGTDDNRAAALTVIRLLQLAGSQPNVADLQRLLPPTQAEALTPVPAAPAEAEEPTATTPAEAPGE